jgi:hypothetical protein
MISFKDWLDEAKDPNHKVLQHAHRLGFKEATKSVGLWAHKIGKKKTIKTLEGPVTASKGDWHCVGAGKEHWPQKHESLHAKYDPTRKRKMINGKVHNWFEPKKDQESVHAVEMNKKFKVHTSWGKLHGNKGEYLVKKKTGNDAWIVKRGLFHSTYEFKQ